MKDTFRIEYNSTFLEYLNSVLYVIKKGKLLKRFILFLSILSIGSWVLGILTTETIDIYSFLLSVAPILMLLIIFTVAITIFSFVIFKTKPSTFNNIIFNFNHWGITRTDNKNEFSTPWRNILKFAETNNTFFIYIDKIIVFNIPKRVFQSLDELNDFRNFLTTNIITK